MRRELELGVADNERRYPQTQQNSDQPLEASPRIRYHVLDIIFLIRLSMGFPLYVSLLYGAKGLWEHMFAVHVILIVFEIGHLLE